MPISISITGSQNPSFNRARSIAPTPKHKTQPQNQRFLPTSLPRVVSSESPNRFLRSSMDGTLPWWCAILTHLLQITYYTVDWPRIQHKMHAYLVNRYRLTFPSFCCYLVFELNQEGVYYNVLRTRNFTEKIYDYLWDSYEEGVTRAIMIIIIIEYYAY